MAKTMETAMLVREMRDSRGKPMQKFHINGRTIKTNLGAWQSVMWNGSDVPKKYKCHHLGFRESMNEAFDKLFEEGYNEIRFVECSTCVRGYHNVYVWYC